MIKKETAIEHCRRLIEADLHWGDPADWTNEDFEDLSEKIFARTSVRLSVSTLKRIWGKVRYESSPTAATLNALARFAGCGSWREFLQQQEAPAPLPARELSADPLTAPGDGSAMSGHESAMSGHELTMRGKRRKIRMSTIVLVVIIGVGVLSLFSSRLGRSSGSRQPADPPGLRFESRKISDDLPNSVVFTYDARPLHPQKVMIQQSWDPARREEVDPNGTAYTSLYYYPGYFVAHLVVDGESKRTCEVFIPTKGWKGIVERKPLPIYLTAGERMIGGATLGITASLLKDKTGAALFNNTWVDFTNVREIDEIPADHFTLTTSLRNTATVEECLCRKVKITVLGKMSAIIIPLVDKGCISDIGLLSGDRWTSGKDHDLSAFGCDFRNFQDLTCTVADHRLSISLNKIPIFSIDHPNSIKKIMGIRIEFEGPGEIREMRLSGPGQQVDLLAH